MKAEALALDEHLSSDSERRDESAPELVPVEAPRYARQVMRDTLSLSEVVQTLVRVSDDRRAMTSDAPIQELARHDPTAAVARLLVDDLTEDTATRTLRVLASTLAGRPSDGVSFVVGTLRRRGWSESFVKALSTFERYVRMPRTAQRLEQFLATRPAPPAPREDEALTRLRQLEQEVEEAYDAIDALLSAKTATPEEKDRAMARLEDALEREAAVAREVLERRMPSLERTAETARRADELIARYEPDAS